jgi:hypothetical protein
MVGQMLNPQQPYMKEFTNAINQHAFNQQLGRGASNQMYEPSPGQSDPYTASRRPNYMPFGPNQQFYQPIYRPSYDQQVRTMDQMYQPMMPQPMLSPQPTQTQYNPISMQQTQPRGGFRGLFSAAGQALSRMGGQGPSNYPYSVNYDAPMTPQPMQSQYRPIPYMTQTQIDARAQAQAAADAAAQAAMPSFDGGGAKSGGRVHGEGIDSLLRK